MDADEAEAVADVAAPDPARVALAARRERPQRDPGARRHLIAAVRPDGLDRRGDLVALDARERRADGLVQLAGEEVEVRAADPDGLGPDDDLARSGRLRLGHVVAQFHGARGVGDGGAHVVPRAARLVLRTSGGRDFRA
jgi:hypothetical protein